MTIRKPQFMSRRRKPPGSSPGMLVAPEGATQSTLYAFAYNNAEMVEMPLQSPGDIVPLLKKWDVVWVNITGLGNIAVIEEFGNILNLHRLALEDILNTSHRPKTEDYGDHLFIITRMAATKGDSTELEQISMFVGNGFVLTFQESPGDPLDPVRARIRAGKGQRIRNMHSDYLAYAIIDAVIDGYFPVLEACGERLYTLEDDVVNNPSRGLISRIHAAKRELRGLRQALWPMREMLNGFASDTDVLQEVTRPYLRDAHDHIIQTLDMLETYRDMTSGLLDIYLSSLNNRMNEIMKVLTIIATIFMPLSFIASVYGMNFDTSSSPLNMPELHWYYGYPFAIGLMASVAGALLLYFHHRKWF